MRSCIMPGLPANEVQELNVGTVDTLKQLINAHIAPYGYVYYSAVI